MMHFGLKRTTGWKPVPRRRAGFTILEVGVIFTLSTMLVALAVVLFSSLLQAQQQVKKRDRIRRELMRLDVFLRRDAHAATSAKIAEPDTCTLRDEQGSQWRYRADGPTLVREASKNDKVTQREVFHLIAGAQSSWSQEPVGSRQMLKLKIVFPKATGRTSRQTDYDGEVLIGRIVPNAGKEAQP